MPISQPRPTNPHPLRRVSPTDGYPLSVGQERLWWLHQLDSSYDEYHISGGWLFPNGLDRAALSAALAGLVRRHEVLRTRFVLRPDGTIAQEVLAEARIPVVWAGAQWRQAVAPAVEAPFDLTRAPVARAVVAELDEGPALFMALHHIITDRWSMDVMARDLFELYDAALTGREPDLPDLPVQYGDYAVWQRRFPTGDLLDYWKRTLAGFQRLELPQDRPRPARSTGAVGRTVVVEVSEGATAALTAMAWRTRASQVMVVTAGLVAALKAFTGQSDVVVGAIVSDRPHPDLQDVLGFFINTVVLRIDLSAASTFREVVVRTRDAWLGANAHQDVPFEEVVGAVGVGSDDGRNPIFDVAVNHAGDNVALLQAPDAPTQWWPEIPVTARFDLSLTTTVVNGRLRATFLYKPELFDEAPIAALAARYARLLEQAAAAPDRPLHELALIEEAELKLLHARNDTTPAPETTVVELLQRQAAERPHALAVVGATGELTFRQLNERANRLARHLVERGAGPERVIAVCLERVVERFVVLLAIAKTGAAYLPLDPDFPPDRLRFLLSDTGAVLTVASLGLADRVPPGTTPVLVFGAEEPDRDDHPADDPPPAALPDDLAYLIYTSGSTGSPKAVAVPHRALSRLVAGARRYLEVGPGSVFLQDGPLTFDVSVLEWTPLAHGGTVVVTDTGTLLDGLEEVLRRHGVTTLKLVSPQLDLIVERGVGMLSGLRQLVVGGDVVNPKSFRTVAEAFPACQVMASYGPTECTVFATVFEGGPWSGRVPIGHPIPYTSVYVLDEDLNPVSVGMRGEVYLAGDGLARGYLGRPGLTAASFVPNPFGPLGSRMYRTGDLGRRLPNGAVDFLGRADHQVKIRGFRIETSEVEHALLRRPGITSAVVVRAELTTGPALVAYVVATDPVDPAALRRELRAALPAYMVPDHVVEVPRLVLTANNKVDRSALPPVKATRPGPTETTPPTNGLVSRVAEAWTAVLGRPVPSTGDFFDHGGHSLLVPRATAAVRQLLGREIPLRLMMGHRTPASYAAAVLREAHGASRDHHLETRTWQTAAFPGERRLDFFRSVAGPDGSDAVRCALVVLDGSEFADIMRLPSIVDELVLGGRIPPTTAVLVSPTELAARGRELLDDAFVDVLADEVLPRLHEWLGDEDPARATALGASLGAVTAVRAALRRFDRFDGAVALSGPLSDHRLVGEAEHAPARFFLSASHEEAAIVLDDGRSLVDATARTAEDLAGRGHTVRCEYGDGGHTYAAWESMLPRAIEWALGNDR